MASYQPRKHPFVLDLSFFRTTNAPKLIISFWVHLAMSIKLSELCGFKVEGQKLFSSFRSEQKKKTKTLKRITNVDVNYQLFLFFFFLISFIVIKSVPKFHQEMKRESHFHHFWACQGTLDVFDGLGVKYIDSSGPALLCHWKHDNLR